MRIPAGQASVRAFGTVQQTSINGVTQSTLFCERAPHNKELSGVVNAQLQGVDPGLFGSPSTGIVAFGACKFLISSFIFWFV